MGKLKSDVCHTMNRIEQTHTTVKVHLILSDMEPITSQHASIKVRHAGLVPLIILLHETH